jgi:hypothetical protein
MSGYYLINRKMCLFIILSTFSDFCPTQNSPHVSCGIIEVTQWLDEMEEGKGMQKFHTESIECDTLDLSPLYFIPYI